METNPYADDPGRIPFPPAWWTPEADEAPFAAVTRRALALAGALAEGRETGLEGTEERVEEPSTAVRAALASLVDCRARGALHETYGATFRSVSYAGRLLGMGDEERKRWVRLAKDLGLAQRHVGHIIARITGAEPEAPPEDPPPRGGKLFHAREASPGRRGSRGTEGSPSILGVAREMNGTPPPREGGGDGGRTRGGA